jgi:voltage-gated potassium channel
MPSADSTPISRLFMKRRHTPERVLLRRILLLLTIVAVILGLFWFDRGGLKDQIDGHISFTDVAYFTAVTVTTVGYGDIVPVSDRARIIDTVLVTPLRLVIWFIFLGTAYELVLQRWLETRRMMRLQKTLSDHIIVCGYGHSGQSAAREAAARGTPAGQILVIDREPARLELAAAEDFIGLLGDPTREQDLIDAGLARAKAVLICLGRDDAAVLTVLTVRQLNAKLRVVCTVAESENIKLIRQAGADSIVAPSIVGGYLLADSIESPHIADYVSDLMSFHGPVRLSERAARSEEVGRPMRELPGGIAVRLHRQGEEIGFWEGPRAVVQAGDRLLVIEHQAGS